MQARLPDIRKIAVLRANALGDYLFTIPALIALRETYPTAEIVLLGLRWHHEFLRDRAGPVDHVEVIPPYHEVGYVGEPQPEAEAAFFAAMQAERFDLAIQLHGGGRNSNPFVQRLAARFTAGLATPDAPTLDFTLPYVYYQAEVMRYLEVVRLVGAATTAIEPTLALRDRDMAEARAALPPAERLVILHPGATDPRRRWPVAQFAAVADALAAEGATIAVSGTAHERPLVEGVIAAMRAPALDLCDKLSMGGLAAALAQADLLVSNDTGPFHLAGAVGTPAVGIFWLTNVITAVEPFRAQRRLAIAWRTTCPVCAAPLVYSDYANTAGCDHRESVVADVPMEEVLSYARELLVQPELAQRVVGGD